jgi:hypothetical protein
MTPASCFTLIAGSYAPRVTPRLTAANTAPALTARSTATRSPPRQYRRPVPRGSPDPRRAAMYHARGIRAASGVAQARERRQACAASLRSGFERSRQLARPIRASQLGTPHALNTRSRYGTKAGPVEANSCYHFCYRTTWYEPTLSGIRCTRYCVNAPTKQDYLILAELGRYGFKPFSRPVP